MNKLAAFTLVLLSVTSTTVYSGDTCPTLFRQQAGFRSDASSTDLYFVEKIDQIEEHTLRSGKTATHIYLEGAQAPYMFFAFPAGNSGVALWFKSARQMVDLSAIGQPVAVRKAEGMHGASIDLKANAKSLVIDDSVLGSMRFIRDRELNLQIPKEVQTDSVKVVNGSLVFQRKSINGLVDYLLEIEPLGDTRVVQSPDGLTLNSATTVQMRVKGYTSEKPLTPLRPEDVFTEKALRNMDPRKLQAFSFLLYKEKLMAGSPRYLSKFGRDSIFTLNVLMDDLKPEAIENLLSATLSSLEASTGRVSHEQHEGDFASYERLKHGKPVRGMTDAIEDYKMVDDDFAFALVIAKYIQRYPARVKAFMDGSDQRGLSRRDLVQKNFGFVAKSAEPFARNPVYRNLIRLEKGEKTGQWRDSENGLGGGVYPFDVNAALVPGALKALLDISSSNATEFYNTEKAQALGKAFEVWNTQAMPLFDVRIPAAEVAIAARDYLRSLGIDPSQAPLWRSQDIEFPAVSLDDQGKPVRIMHSDDSLMMTFGHPSQAYLAKIWQRARLPFPYGLNAQVGLLVANPVFVSPELQRLFDPTKYHGLVSWTMQEDLMVFGIDRQLQRRDLSPELRRDLTLSREAIEKVIQSKAAMGGTEVFSIVIKDGKYRAVPFAGDAKSNSNQLWSHLRIAGPQRR